MYSLLYLFFVFKKTIDTGTTTCCWLIYRRFLGLSRLLNHLSSCPRYVCRAFGCSRDCSVLLRGFFLSCLELRRWRAIMTYSVLQRSKSAARFGSLPIRGWADRGLKNETLSRYPTWVHWIEKHFNLTFRLGFDRSSLALTTPFVFGLMLRHLS